MAKFLLHIPVGFFFRKALRKTQDVDTCKAIALLAVQRAEDLESWIREQGLEPPVEGVSMLNEEAKARGLEIEE